jgi:predicted nucleic acid-binding protein
MICLDTNVVIGLLNDEASAAQTRFDETVKAGTELRYGEARSARQDYNTQRIDAFLAGPFAIWPFDADDVREAGDIRATLAGQERRLDPTMS